MLIMEYNELGDLTHYITYNFYNMSLVRKINSTENDFNWSSTHP